MYMYSCKGIKQMNPNKYQEANRKEIVKDRKNFYYFSFNK